MSKPHQSVTDLLGRGFSISFELGMLAILVAVVSGVGLGILAALRHNGLIDFAALVFAVLGISIPIFILAILLFQHLAVNRDIFPVATWASSVYMVLTVIAVATGPMKII